MRFISVILLVLAIAPVCSALDCENPRPTSRVFQFNPATGEWRFDDRCTGASRQGVAAISKNKRVWTIAAPALLAIWDVRNRHGLAAVFPRPNSDQWNPVPARFVMTSRISRPALFARPRPTQTGF